MPDQNSLSPYFNTDRRELVHFLDDARFSAAIDLGCASGLLGRELISSRVVQECDGVELNPQAARVASEGLRKVWEGAVETVFEAIPWGSYDLIVMADVLEHLADPWQVLRELHTHTSENANLLISVPNVRHYSVIFPLLFSGHFEYQDVGIMDRTHLHFYTRLSLLKILSDTGWKVQKVRPNIKSKYLKWWYPHHLLEQFLAVQYFTLASK
jgi:2-polyprenyl-3-methyl-5-hydroxy-6-metoxy-1,4-benzoquinol methylase